jgi:hypothetical protein
VKRRAWWRLAAAHLFLAGAAGVAGGLQPLASNQRQETPGALIERVDRVIKDLQPTSAERRLDDIGWAKDLRDALRLAKDNGRPVFLFTYNGSPIRENAICLQRC